MKPSEVRQQVLAEHAALRDKLAELEQIAHPVLEGERGGLRSLRLEGETLLKLLLDHIQWEDVNLEPALRRSDVWGDARAEKLARDHREQRELLEHALRGLQDQSRPAVIIARSLVDLVALVREDMIDEEASLLDERVLRDDAGGG
ncbi:MAG: hemerythrin domain-containing protein [Myxococcales bacterium]|nr:hemerythrin domain-containing protein [Myxococcales bacterium]